MYEEWFILPTTQDVKSLLKGMIDGNWYRIAEVSDRIASKLQKQGHTEDAEEIRQMTSKRDNSSKQNK